MSDATRTEPVANIEPDEIASGHGVETAAKIWTNIISATNLINKTRIF